MGDMSKKMETNSMGSVKPSKNGNTTVASQAVGEEIGILGAFLGFCAIAAISVGTILFIIVIH
jgi:hypothetical protein